MLINGRDLASDALGLAGRSRQKACRPPSIAGVAGADTCGRSRTRSVRDGFARFAAQIARVVRDECDLIPFYCPINEISFWSWAGGEVGRINPFLHGQGPFLKRQLVRAAIAAIEAIWSVEPHARIVHTDPVINVVAGSEDPEELARAEAYRCAQFETWDMLSGRRSPELGGYPKYLDVLGLNYYWNNQWIYGSPTVEEQAIGFGHPDYSPVENILIDIYERYQRPLFVSETGIEGRSRPSWLRYIAGEVHAAIDAGVPVEGVCIYPILHYPGWEDDRACECGLLGSINGSGRRPVYQPLANELGRQQALLRSDVP